MSEKQLGAPSVEGRLPSPEMAFENGLAGIHDDLINKLDALWIPESSV